MPRKLLAFPAGESGRILYQVPTLTQTCIIHRTPHLVIQQDANPLLYVLILMPPKQALRFGDETLAFNTRGLLFLLVLTSPREAPQFDDETLLQRSRVRCADFQDLLTEDEVYCWKSNSHNYTVVAILSCCKKWHLLLSLEPPVLLSLF